MLAEGAACIFEETGELVGCEYHMQGRAVTPERGEEIWLKTLAVANGESSVSEELGHQEFILTYKQFEPAPRLACRFDEWRLSQRDKNHLRSFGIGDVQIARFDSPPRLCHQPNHQNNAPIGRWLRAMLNMKPNTTSASR